MNHSAVGTPISPLESDSPGVENKKRKAGSSGRGVASLTPDQLAKKRANDREAQRAIRERTKSTIESLERKIQQLESQQPYQELQAIVRQKDAVQAENDEIRRRLASILSIIQPVVGAQGLTDLATAAQNNVQLSFGQQNNNVFQQPDPYLNNGQRQFQSHSPGLSSPQDSTYPPAFSSTDQESMTENRVWTSSRDALNQQRNNFNRTLELNESGERLTFNFLLDGANQKHTQVPNVTSNNILAPQNRNAYPANSFPDSTPPAWSMLPKNCAPTCPLDNILLNFLQARQRDTNNGTTILTPAYPSVSSLLNPTSNRDPNVDPISQLMTDIISKFPNISALPEQVATLFCMFLFMRWQVYPTPENYERLPDWLTPRPSQLFTAHPAWVDHLPFPRMRDRVINNYQDFPFENWFLPFTSGLSVNWPYEPVDCLISTGDGGITTINPVFERHARRLDNWTLGPQFQEAFPELVDTANFKEIKTSLGQLHGHALGQGIRNGA
jgi:hypothetical protein